MKQFQNGSNKHWVSKKGTFVVGDDECDFLENTSGFVIIKCLKYIWTFNHLETKNT